MKSTLDYLVEVSLEQSEKLFKNLLQSKNSIQVKVNDVETIFNSAIEKSDHKDQFFLINKALQHLQRNATFKITLADDIYFFKADIRGNEKQGAILRPQHIFKLIRRKQPRHKIPVAWHQSALMVTLPLKHSRFLIL